MENNDSREKLRGVNPEYTQARQNTMLAEADKKISFAKQEDAQSILAFKIKTFEANLILNGRNTIDKKEFDFYTENKKKYADRYLNGVVPESLITSFGEAKEILLKSTGSDFTEELHQRKLNTFRNTLSLEEMKARAEKIEKEVTLKKETEGTHTLEEVMQGMEKKEKVSPESVFERVLA